MKKNEPWLEKIKEQLNEYSEHVPENGWEQLRKELSDSQQPILHRSKAKTIAFKKWTMVAVAATVILGISLISIRLMHNQWLNHITPQNIVSDNNISQNIEQKTNEIKQKVLETSIPITTTIKQIHPQLIAEDLSSILETTEDEQTREELTITEIESNTDTTLSERGNYPNLKRKSKKESFHQQQYNENQQYKQKRAHKRNNKWSLGLSINNTGGLTDLATNERGANIIQQSPNNIIGENINLSSITTGLIAIPEGQELVFEDGMPYLRTQGNQITSIKHKQPLSFGFSLRKGLTKGLSIETGLTYTYLASDVVLDNNTTETEQKLHYLGIPLRANWNFIDHQTFTLYISAGGMIEKCILGKLGNENQTVKPLQLSVMGAIGAQYNASKRVGIYLEPGISYYFDDGSTIQTIRKERPCTFTLQAGIRLTY